jgi:hypothetical protein
VLGCHSAHDVAHSPYLCIKLVHLAAEVQQLALCLQPFPQRLIEFDLLGVELFPELRELGEQPGRDLFAGVERGCGRRVRVC